MNTDKKNNNKIQKVILTNKIHKTRKIIKLMKKKQQVTKQKKYKRSSMDNINRRI